MEASGLITSIACEYFPMIFFDEYLRCSPNPHEAATSLEAVVEPHPWMQIKISAKVRTKFGSDHKTIS